jgi:hypothetical protein
MIRFATAGRSVAVYTETLGTKRHHGKVALLVNEHSASAAEMVAALASEYGLATLVGTKTAGLTRRDERLQYERAGRRGLRFPSGQRRVIEQTDLMRRESYLTRAAGSLPRATARTSAW